VLDLTSDPVVVLVKRATEISLHRRVEDGRGFARQNVIHEVGLFQGRYTRRTGC
jgi:hypothetical protein